MAAVTSTLAAARAALVDLIDAALPGVQVDYGAPPADEQRREFVAITTSSSGQVDDVHLKAGRRTREEDHETVVQVVVQTQQTPRAAEARACELAAAVEDILATDPKLGGVPGLIAAWPVRIEIDCGYAAEGLPVCVLELTIRMKARLV